MPAVIEKRAVDSNALAAIQGKVLRCFIYQERSGLFVAECIDLNLIVKAKSPAKAQASLKDAIIGYLNVAVQGDTRGLIPRRSPLSRRLYYHWLRFRFSKVQVRAKNTPRIFEIQDCLSAA